MEETGGGAEGEVKDRETSHKGCGTDFLIEPPAFGAMGKSRWVPGTPGSSIREQVCKDKTGPESMLPA